MTAAVQVLILAGDDNDAALSSINVFNPQLTKVVTGRAGLKRDWHFTAFRGGAEDAKRGMFPPLAHRPSGRFPLNSSECKHWCVAVRRHNSEIAGAGGCHCPA